MENEIGPTSPVHPGGPIVNVAVPATTSALVSVHTGGATGCGLDGAGAAALAAPCAVKPSAANDAAHARSRGVRVIAPSRWLERAPSAQFNQGYR